MRRVALYAAGGGRGHGVRAAELARAIEAEGAEAIVIVPRERGLGDLGARSHVLGHAHDRASTARAVRDAIEAHKPDVWVTDAFPDGPAGELAEIELPPAVLVARAHRDGKHARFAERTARYARVIDLEPHLGWRAPELSAAELTPFVRSDVEREELDATVLFVADDAALGAMAERLAVSLRARGVATAVARDGVLSLGERAVSAFPSPVLRLRPHVVVGPAGLNLTYEACSVGAHHLAIPRPRRFDDQALRAERVAERIRSPRELAFRIDRLLRSRSARAACTVGDARDVARTILSVFS